MNNNHIDNKSLEQWLWDAACSIRGAKDAPKYKDFILPLERLTKPLVRWGHGQTTGE
jgi:hypothetical protein